MKTFKKYVILTNTELDNLQSNFYKKGYESGGEDSQERIESLEKSVERRNKQNEKLTQTNEDLQEKVEVLSEERDNVRDVVKKEMELKDKEAVLNQAQELMDDREARLKDRESKLGVAEEGEYKKGYADGVADGVRKIHEVTAADRENAMKIAMVAASSHTPVANMKEINGAHQITSGNTDKES